MTGHNGPTRGAIGVIDRSKGVNAQEAIENITPDVPVPKVNEGNGNTDGSKHYSCPLAAGRRAVPVSRSAGRSWCGRSTASASRSRCLRPADGMQYFSAQPIRPRPRPPVIAPQIASPAEDNMATRRPAGRLQRPGAAGRSAARSRRSAWSARLPKPLRIDPSLRAFGFQFPVISCGATYAAKKVLGEVPVEADGSACFRVPAGHADLLHGPGRPGPGRAAHAELHPPDAGRGPGLRRLPRAPAANLAAADGRGRQPAAAGPAAAGVGHGRASTTRGSSSRCSTSTASSATTAIDPPNRIDLTGGKTDFFNVSYDVLARENQGPRGSPVRQLDSHLQRPGVEHPAGAAEDLGLAAEQAGRGGACPAIRTRTASRGSRWTTRAAGGSWPGST